MVHFDCVYFPIGFALKPKYLAIMYLIKRDNNLLYHLPIHSTIQLSKLEKKVRTWKMNTRYFKEVVGQIQQQIWNNVHEATPFSQNYKRSFDSTSNFVRIKPWSTQSKRETFNKI